ncbi:outer membrane beta-barrel protein [Rhizobium sp. G21]|uniref:outer membrane beta-barrel protein n=1 Tax=Rhizobium sp. G21 TaxID=2758439 RepID=UPI001600F944|nr:outer membrane beta-barrel protein [Rhizobium sp. G21]MBB1249886.1 outer membrane beta-barrel protein [Rhizobium sp. G21]
MSKRALDARLKSRILSSLLIVAGATLMCAADARAQSATMAPPSDETDRTWAATTTDQTAEPGDADDQTRQDVQPTPDADIDRNAAADAALRQDLGRQNLSEQTVDGLRARRPESEETPGIPVGAFTLRPTITGGAGFEREKSSDRTKTRSYLQTGLKGSLTSNWSEHELRIDTNGTWQKTLSGFKSDDPEGSINAALRLDISNDMIANLTAGYSLEREDIGDANAIDGATNQAEVATWTAGASITRDLGLIRGTLGVDFERETYGDATLSTGQRLDQSDRNQNTATLRGRLGYELSPALIPFIEASYGRMIYDNTRDGAGYLRDADLYAAKTGVEFDMGEKLRGEIGAGYTIADFKDGRLDQLSGLTINGDANWSPQRGTDVALGLKTDVEPSTSAGSSGSIAYTTDMALTQVIIEDLRGKLSAGATWRDYKSAAANQTVYDLGAGVTWGISRSLDLTADVAWERSSQKGSAAQETLTGLVGLSLKR